MTTRPAEPEPTPATPSTNRRAARDAALMLSMLLPIVDLIGGFVVMSAEEEYLATSAAGGLCAYLLALGVRYGLRRWRWSAEDGR